MFTETVSEAEAAERLVYRNGFVVSMAPLVGYPFRSWAVHRLGRFVLQIHPDAVSRLHRLGDHVLIGDAFDPEHGIYDEVDVLARLASAPTERDFLEVLDRLAGRFAFIASRDNGEVEIFHDAMGTRSVYYSETEPLAASHAEIVAKATGKGFAAFFEPFVDAPSYAKAPVKYLPGLATPYEAVLQLTPNTKLRLSERNPARFWPFGASRPTMVTRYWPRADRQERPNLDDAVQRLVDHVQGLAQYFATRNRKAALGLTAGKDSRLLFAAFHKADPYLFTFVRSQTGSQIADSETRMARLLAERYGCAHEVYAIPTRPPEEEVVDPFAYAYRRSSSYLRGATAIWQKRLAGKNFDHGSTRFVRGSGGEVLRGFYQRGYYHENKLSIDTIEVRSLVRAYGINGGSPVSSVQFARFMEVADFHTGSLRGWDPNDMFYWEHRMGLWGSAALSEADLALPALAGYNSRNLFASFLSLPWAERNEGRAFQKATARLAPRFADLPD